METAPASAAKQQSPIKPGWAVVLFTLTAIVMVGHEAEHVVQLWQKIQGNACPFACRGLMGSVFDVEWVHWIYNISTFLTLVISWLGMRMWQQPMRDWRPFAWWSLTVGIFAVQGYHVMEHSAKIGQWLINGHHSPTPGLIGALLPPPTPGSFSLIEMHFTINTIVFVMVAFGYLGLAIFKLLPSSLKIESSSPFKLALLLLACLMLATGAFWATNKLLLGSHEEHQEAQPTALVISHDI